MKKLKTNVLNTWMLIKLINWDVGIKVMHFFSVSGLLGVAGWPWTTWVTFTTLEGLKQPSSPWQRGRSINPLLSICQRRLRDLWRDWLAFLKHSNWFFNPWVLLEVLTNEKEEIFIIINHFNKKKYLTTTPEHNINKLEFIKEMQVTSLVMSL